jgi:very-short-patch-repair endonuclease
MINEKRCFICNCIFIGNKFCSRKCYYEYKIKYKILQKRKKIFCLICNKEFEVNAANIKKFCSPSCYFEYKRKNKIGGRLKSRKIIKCILCNKDVEVTLSSRRKYCSRICSDKMNIGRQYSIERKNKISFANKDKKRTEEQKEKYKINGMIGGNKLKEIRTGKTYEELYGNEKAKILRDKISKAHIGQISNKRGKTFIIQFGEKRANEIKEKIRNTVIKKQNGIAPKMCWKKGHISWRQGKTLEEIYGKKEAKERMRKWRLVMDDKCVVPLKDSKPEVITQNILTELNVDFIKHKYLDNIIHKYQCDIFIPKYNIIIEVDGKYWHKYPEGREIDHIRTKEMQNAGYKVLRFWEGEINKECVQKELEVIKNDSK